MQRAQVRDFTFTVPEILNEIDQVLQARDDGVPATERIVAIRAIKYAGHIMRADAPKSLRHCQLIKISNQACIHHIPSTCFTYYNRLRAISQNASKKIPLCKGIFYALFISKDR